MAAAGMGLHGEKLGLISNHYYDLVRVGPYIQHIRMTDPVTH